MMSTIETPGKTAETTRCPLCNAPLEEPDRCSKCDWVRGEQERREQRLRANPVDLTACLLSIVPGLGHFYKGQRRLAVLYFIGAGFALFWAIVFASSTVCASLLAPPAYWAWVMTHAYLAEDLNAKERPAVAGL
ncbi:MAG TPA: hypothetical protein VG733_02775 [Chthoniobacteraceae bacterium]|nr:hypothetical protein [Chthoniobacteraceae bacterium]